MAKTSSCSLLASSTLIVGHTSASENTVCEWKSDTKVKWPSISGKLIPLWEDSCCAFKIAQQLIINNMIFLFPNYIVSFISILCSILVSILLVKYIDIPINKIRQKLVKEKLKTK